MNRAPEFYNTLLPQGQGLVCPDRIHTFIVPYLSNGDSDSHEVYCADGDNWWVMQARYEDTGVRRKAR